MKHSLFTIVFLVANLVSAQTPETKGPSENLVYISTAVEQPPQFQDGEKSFLKFFFKNFKMPDQPLKSGEIVLSFIVERNGTLTEIKSVRDFGYVAANEAIRVMKNGPKWSPAKVSGEPVRCRHQITIAVEDPQTRKRNLQPDIYQSQKYKRN